MVISGVHVLVACVRVSATLGETFSTDMNENTGLRSALQPSDVTVHCFHSIFVFVAATTRGEAISLHSQCRFFFLKPSPLSRCGILRPY